MSSPAPAPPLGPRRNDSDYQRHDGRRGLVWPIVNYMVSDGLRRAGQIGIADSLLLIKKSVSPSIVTR